MGFIFTISTIISTGQAVAADTSIAQSRVQIIKTASVRAVVESTFSISSESMDTYKNSMPICMETVAPHSVSIDKASPKMLSDASGTNQIEFSAKLQDQLIRGQESSCLTNPFLVDVSIDEKRWEAASDGLYAGTLKLTVTIE